MFMRIVADLVTPKFSLGGSLANRTFGMKAVTIMVIYGLYGF